MTVDPRAALDRFIASLEAHYGAIANRRGDQDSSVDDAYDVLADAFDVYDEALGNTFGEATPFLLADDEDGEDEEDDDLDETDLDGSDLDEVDLAEELDR